MSGYADKVQKRAAEVLHPGEHLVSAIRTQPSGSTTGMAVGGLVGAAIAEKQARKSRGEVSEGSIAQTWPQGRFAVALTDERLLTFNYTAMGKPKDLTSELPLQSITSIDLNKKKITNGVRFAFSDGSMVEVECAKLEKVDDFVSAFQKVKATSAT